MAVLKRIWWWLKNPQADPKTVGDLYEKWAGLYDEVRALERRGLEPSPSLRHAEGAAYTDWSLAQAERREP